MTRSGQPLPPLIFEVLPEDLDAARRQNERAAGLPGPFRQALKDVEGINADDWTPRELRHSFVSLFSDRGVPLEEISRLVGHFRNGRD